MCERHYKRLMTHGSTDKPPGRVAQVGCSVNDDECVPGRIRVGMCERHYRRVKSCGSTADPHIDNFNRYEVAPNGCWLWAGPIYTGRGYGKLSKPEHGTRVAHRAFYIEHRGTYPAGLDLDHQCHNRDIQCPGGIACEHRRCVNPDHLEPATRSVNILRGAQRAKAAGQPWAESARRSRWG